MTRKLTRRQTILELLKAYPEACGPGESGQGSGSVGDRLLTMTDLWQEARPHFLELERCLASLKEERPNQYVHLKARYFKAKRLSQDVPVRAGRLIVPSHAELVGFGKLKDSQAKTARAILIRWEPWVRNQKVEKAVDYLNEEFRGEPFLPKELLEAVAA
jgi:hypothetical protein